MALPATDSFTDTNGVQIDSHSASWTVNPGDGNSQFDIQSNALAPDNSAYADEVAHWNADAFNAAQYAEATVAALGSGGPGGGGIGVAVRVATNGDCTGYNYYGDSDWRYIAKVIDGEYTELASVESPWSVNDDIRIEASGTTITPLLNGGTDAGLGAQTDASISSGAAGVSGWGDQTGSRIDNWEGGNLGGAGPWVFGEQNPTEGETPVSWATWSDGAAGSPTISGDADWGKLELAIGEEGRSAVYDIGADGYDHIFIVNENVYGTGQGTATLQIRGSAASFNQDDGEPPNWENYTAPITRSWRYVQIRETK